MDADALDRRYRELQAYVGWTADDARRVQSVADSLDSHLRPSSFTATPTPVGSSPAVDAVLRDGADAVYKPFDVPKLLDLLGELAGKHEAGLAADRHGA